MTQEDKQLLLKDLCERLPYGVKINIKSDYTREMEDTELTPYHLDGLGYNAEYRNLRPYLRPMSSMTSDERIELSIILNYEFYVDDDFALVAEDDRHRIRLELCESCINWLNEHHFDFRKLIEKGLALEAPEDMYKTEKK